MNDISKFQELIKKTLETAKNQDNKIDTEEINGIFSDMELSTSQLDQIKDYLAANKIDVSGYQKPAQVMEGGMTERKVQEDFPADGENADNEEYPEADRPDNYEGGTGAEKIESSSVYLRQYQEELKAIKSGTREEEILLLGKIRKGDSSAKERFIELNLGKVMEIAYEYRNRGMNTEDLIQEGNFALIKALGALPETMEEAALTDHILNQVRTGICEALSDQQENDDFENIVIEKSNRIFQALKELEEKSGKKADIHELAEFMKLSEDEIMDTLELSGDAIKLEHTHKDEG